MGGAHGGQADGRYTFFLEVDRCSGCEACVVACMDQNDLEGKRKEDAWRTVIALESAGVPAGRSGGGPGEAAEEAAVGAGGGSAGGPAITFVSLACMHCGDAPCVLSCPTGALGRDEAIGSVVVDQSRCMGCRSCAMACPFGVPRFGRNGRMEKCDLCAVRVEYGFEPACVRVCSTKALRFGFENDVSAAVQRRAAERLAQGHS
ncbi:MAG: 4Fe-4S dicluster domain-containing protein [Thermoleophilia bacterium]